MASGVPEALYKGEELRGVSLVAVHRELIRNERSITLQQPGGALERSKLMPLHVKVQEAHALLLVEDGVEGVDGEAAACTCIGMCMHL